MKLLKDCTTLEEIVETALEMVRRTEDSKEVAIIAIALMAKIRGWMDDVARTVMDGPEQLPETVKAEDERIRKERRNSAL